MTNIVQVLKTKITVFIQLIAILALIGGYFVSVTNTVNAQSAEASAYCDDRYSPGQSDWAQCLEDYEDAEETCNRNHTTGTSSWQNCLDQIPDDLDAPVGGGGGGGGVGSDECEESGGVGCADDEGPGLDVGVEQIDSAPTCGDTDERGVDVSFVTDDGDMCVEFDEDNASLEDNPIFVILGRVIQFLLAAVGIGLTAVIVIAGFQYMTANGDPQKVSSARKKIGFAITGVILYVFAGAILNFLVPGGVI